MKKQEIARYLAKQARTSQAEAADQLDRVVHDILIDLRRGKSVRLPGWGTFTPGPKLGFQFTTHSASKGSRNDSKQR
jgi:nucleoid DNA-binding protein